MRDLRAAAGSDFVSESLKTSGMTPWTPERIAEAVEMVRRRWRLQSIAQALGGVTPEEVLSMLQRRGLRVTTCRFRLGDPVHSQRCGALVVDGRSFCREHQAMVEGNMDRRTRLQKKRDGEMEVRGC